MRFVVTGTWINADFWNMVLLNSIFFYRMCNEFSQIFQLCQFMMENSQNAPLIQATLETLLRFLNWIPLGYMCETKLISTLIYKVCITTEKRNVPMFWKVSLKSLTEIAGASVSQYEEQHVTCFTLTMMQLKQVMF
ncbi:hypothetical protein ASZ78_011172 [Callipepla squamata]|uniref:Exportin-1/Importin-beta-like domain-containing protein n=1 Tax=Callipepla squamata TaxID=9009 RepID=A0A226M7H8_CALSU|nr:hypothetical protein ASZ78_009335 [Callipepla squamata]OXB51259.1 hypothetical protein ASZ78_002992 [Callipepla squamata]OXB51307.1 hypothetical protein ASZ78_011172 [Callipepla squamata]